jgi:hypothetical protein
MGFAKDIENQRTRKTRRRHGIWLRVLVVTLLVAVAGLSTLAKNTQYLPKTNPAQYVTSATKMKVVHSPVVLNRDRQLPVSRIIVAPPAIWPAREDLWDVPLIPAVGVTVSMQHRSPPAFIS